MSIGPTLSIPTSIAGIPFAQTTGTDLDRTHSDVSAQQRHTSLAIKADSAAGIGATDGEDHETEDRDADGRRMWEFGVAKQSQSTSEPIEQKPSRDASGDSGNALDLSG